MLHWAVHCSIGEKLVLLQAGRAAPVHCDHHPWRLCRRCLSFGLAPGIATGSRALCISLHQPAIFRPTSTDFSQAVSHAATRPQRPGRRVVRGSLHYESAEMYMTRR